MNGDKPVHSLSKVLINVNYYDNNTQYFKYKATFSKLPSFPTYFLSATKGHIYDGSSSDAEGIHGHKISHGTKGQVSFTLM